MHFVIKPKDDFGSKDVNIISNFDDFKKVFTSIDDINKFQVETYLSGKLYDIDSIYNHGETIFQACCEYNS